MPNRRPARLSLRRAGAAAALLAALSACAAGSGPVAGVAPAPAPETRPLAGTLPPAARPERPLSAPLAARDLIGGGEVRLTPRPSGARGVEVAQQDGCRWLNHPPLSWY